MEGGIDAADMQSITWGRAADLPPVAGTSLAPCSEGRLGGTPSSTSVHVELPMCEAADTWLLNV